MKIGWCGGFLSLVLVFAGTPDAVAQRQGMTLTTRPGVTVNVLLETPERAPACILMLPGGPGVVDITGTRIGRSRGFFAAHFEAFVSRGLAAAIAGAPSDHAAGMDPRFRQSEAHRTDVATVIEHLKRTTGLPLWLAGISRGSLSAGYVATRAGHAIDGLVLLSSPTNLPPRAPVKKLTDIGLERIRVPVLAIAHRGDRCPGTPPAGAAAIVARATGSPKAEAWYVQGGWSAGGHPCRPGTHHTFNGVEDRVIDAIAEFIKAGAR